MIHRLWIYQRERFPLLANGALVAVLTAASLLYASLALGATSSLRLDLYVAAFGVALGLFLQLRIFDEFKDYADDKAFRPYRPVPRGVVSLRELGAIGLLVAGMQVVLTAWISWQLLPLLAMVWLYMGLMGREFFVSRWLKAHPLIYMLSHMVITPLILLFLTAWVWLVAGAGFIPGLGWFLAASYGNGMVFEIGRKIRSPEDEEPGVETYSALWGRGGAVAAWIGAMTLAGVCMTAAATFLALAMPIALLFGVLWIGALIVAVRYLQAPVQRRGAAIERYSALWTLLIYLGLIAGALAAGSF
jgi:4-hydroxybenzoate polyprenyltransferase